MQGAESFGILGRASETGVEGMGFGVEGSRNKGLGFWELSPFEGLGWWA